MLKIKVINKDNDTTNFVSGENEVRLVHNHAYEEGDIIVVECDKAETILVIQLDDAIGESFVFIKGRSISYAVPFGENKTCLSPKSFWGDKHLLTVRMATEDEMACYKNLAINKYDQHEETTYFPHASANVETRGESVFAAKNVINGNSENHSHGAWPYESWGINQNPKAVMKVEFGRNVIIDKIRMYIRADFPHDAWWRQVTFQFSDGSNLVWNLKKTDKVQEITFKKKTVEWLKLCNLIKADNPSPFPALSQLEVYGIEQEI